MASSLLRKRWSAGSKRGEAGVRAPAKAWTVVEAKARLSEILRLARAGQPQTIGTEDACVVVSATQFEQSLQSGHLGRYLIESAPRGFELELPSRSHDRGSPFDDVDGSF
jgi:prevent-host-death family protein